MIINKRSLAIFLNLQSIAFLSTLLVPPLMTLLMIWHVITHGTFALHVFWYFNCSFYHLGVQIPTNWRPAFLDANTLKLYFDLFHLLPSHLSSLVCFIIWCHSYTLSINQILFAFFIGSFLSCSAGFSKTDTLQQPWKGELLEQFNLRHSLHFRESTGFVWRKFLSRILSLAGSSKDQLPTWRVG